MSSWIDFKALRAELDFEAVLRHYGVDVNRKGTQFLGFCPLPNHQGKRNSKSFSANLDRGIFQCFGCGAKGNVLEFAALMEKLDPQNGRDLRRVALQLRDRFAPGAEVSRTRNPKAGFKSELPKPTPPPASSALVNHPLDFELKDVDPEHPYLRGRGFVPETVAHFELGFCRRGLLKDRIVIPLYDQAARLVGYAGRVVDDTKVTDVNPRYKFPGRRERNGQAFEFHKSLFVYNGFRIKTPLDDLLVVEGFTAVWWLTQLGFPNVVATMGADCSAEQAGIIGSLVMPSRRVWIISDGDKAGERHARSVLAQVPISRSVRWIKLEEGKQPTDYSGEFFRERLSA